MEGHYDSSAVADMYFFGWVNQKEQKVSGLKIPGGLSFLVYRDFKTPVTGLNAFKTDERPLQVNTVFQVYHIMIAIGILLIASTLFAYL